MALIIITNSLLTEIIRGKERKPVAQNTYFDWLLSGNISAFDSRNLSSVTSMQINISPVLNLGNEFENEVFEKKSLAISEHHTKTFSKKNDDFIENEEVYTEFKKCLAFENNRYCVNLPFKNHSEVSPNNFNVTRSCFISLKRNLNSNSTLLHEYDQIFKDYLNNNIIEEVNENEVVTSAYYLPHHAVIKSDRDTAKTRILFDASAKIDKNEPSLTDILFSGSCLIPLIEVILLRFRLGGIPVVANIQQVCKF